MLGKRSKSVGQSCPADYMLKTYDVNLVNLVRLSFH